MIHDPSVRSSSQIGGIWTLILSKYACFIEYSRSKLQLLVTKREEVKLMVEGMNNSNENIRSQGTICMSFPFYLNRG